MQSKGCDFCSGLTFKRVSGGYMYMNGNRLKLCGNAQNMAPEFATDLCSVDFCPVCGNEVRATEVQRMPVCEICGKPYQVIDDAVTDLVTNGETCGFAVVPVRSVVKNCDCDNNRIPCTRGTKVNKEEN